MSGASTVDALHRPDLASLASRFAHLLHAAGVPVTPATAARFADAIALVDPDRVDELRWIGRATLTFDRAHGETFDRVFDEVFRGVLDPADTTRNPNVTPTSRPSEAPPPRDRHGAELTSPGRGRKGQLGPSSATATDGDDEAVLAAMSDEERLGERAFGDCTPEELEILGSLIVELELTPPLRRHRRSRISRRGREIDLRASLRAARRTGGDPVRLVRRRRRVRPRRVVLFTDVSGSMESYGRAYLYLLHGAVRALGAEAFVFATRLHRLTRPLAARQPAQALGRAMAAAPDWSGGTRIGQALADFNDDHGRRGVARGAVVVIVSDGWEGGDPSLLGREMQRLSRLAHRIVWVNPRRRNEGYEPLVGGMAAALPFVDEFVSGHSLAALREVIAAIGSDAPRRRSTELRRPTVPGDSDRRPAVDRDAEATSVPDTSMRPEYGAARVSPARRWDLTTGGPTTEPAHDVG